MRKPGFRFAILTTLALGVIECMHGTSGRELLPPPPKGTIDESAYRPAQPLESRVDGSLSRTVHRAEGLPFTVEVRDWIIPPGKKVSIAERGAVIVFVRDGSVRVTREEIGTDLTTGGAMALSDGERAELNANGPNPLALRLFAVTAQ